MPCVPLAEEVNSSEGGTHIDGEIEEVELDGLVSAKGLAAANCDQSRLRGRRNALQTLERLGAWQGCVKTPWLVSIADKMQTRLAKNRACHSRKSTAQHGCSAACSGSTAGSRQRQ